MAFEFINHGGLQSVIADGSINGAALEYATTALAVAWIGDGSPSAEAN